MATYVEQSLEKLKEFEGSVPWMYLDTAGNVTVGVGMMLPDAAAAAALPFSGKGGARATNEQVRAEFARVRAMQRGLLPKAYQRAGGPELAAETIEQHLLATLQGLEAELRAKVTRYDGLPDAVKMVLLDMAYNLGLGGLLRGYPRMLAAVMAGEWGLAAKECVRRGISAERNAWARVELLGAGAVVTAIEAMEEGGTAVLRWAGLLLAAGLAVWAVLRAGRARRRTW